MDEKTLYRSNIVFLKRERYEVVFFRSVGDAKLTPVCVSVAVLVENGEHCDFTVLRNMLIR